MSANLNMTREQLIEAALDAIIKADDAHALDQRLIEQGRAALSRRPAAEQPAAAGNALTGAQLDLLLSMLAQGSITVAAAKAKIEQHLRAAPQAVWTQEMIDQPTGALADLWIHEDIDRDATAAVVTLPRKQLEAAYVQAREDASLWRRRALKAEAKGAPQAAQGKGLTVQHATDEIMYHVANEPDRVKVRAIVENTVRTIAAHTRASDGKDAKRLDFVISEECYVKAITGRNSVTFSVVWPEFDERQAECYPTPNEAIDAAMQQAASKSAQGGA